MIHNAKQQNPIQGGTVVTKYSEQDLKYAAELREEIHREALRIVQKTRPHISQVIDRHPVEDYFQEHWDYPGTWYTIVAIPYGYKSRKALVDTIVRDTLSESSPTPDDVSAKQLRKAENEKLSRKRLNNQLDSKPEGYNELFKVELDKKNRSFCAVGEDCEGRYILERYEEYSLEGVTGSAGEYYVLTDTEYRRYLRLALINGQLKQEDYDRLTDEPKKAPKEDDEFYRLLAEYPDLVVDFQIVKGGQYLGYESHRRALESAYEKIRGKCWKGNPDKAEGKTIPAEEMFSSNYKRGKLNYRKAFLYPPHRNSYTGKDFTRVNDTLFPNGTDELEVFEWDTDWSDYFDDGHEWWGALCLTVYDKTLDRFVVIMASATD